MCMKGYCEAGSVLKECRAQVGTCNLLPCCWSHGGALATECIDSFCLCHTGYHDDGKGVCSRGWWPTTALAAMNESERLAVRPFHEPQDEDMARKYTAALIETLPILGVASVAVGLVTTAVVRGRKTRDVSELPQESLYEPLRA